MTILRSKIANRQDFVFFADRLSTLLVEHAMQHLPYVSKSVATPVGVTSVGQKLDATVFTISINFDLFN
jgi:uridine kinase